MEQVETLLWFKKATKAEVSDFSARSEKTPSPKKPMVYPFLHREEPLSTSSTVLSRYAEIVEWSPALSPYLYLFGSLYATYILPIWNHQNLVLVNTRKILDLIFDDHLTSHHSRTYQAKFEWVGRIISAKHREWSGVRPIERPSLFACLILNSWLDICKVKKQFHL